MSDTLASGSQSNQSLRLFGIIFATITVLFVAAYVLYTRFNFEPLYSGLDIEDAALITAELDRQEVRYRVGDNGNSVFVPAKEIGEVRLAIYNTDGPGRNLTGFELFNESEMGLTDFAQKIKFQRAIQGELSRTIMMMDGVKKSRVHIALPERSVFRSQKVEPKAAIILITEPGVNFAQDRVLGIQRLVASSIPELTIGNVIIVDGQGHVISMPTPIEPSFELSGKPEPQGSHENEALYGELEMVSVDNMPATNETAIISNNIQEPLTLTPQVVISKQRESHMKPTSETSQAFTSVNNRYFFILIGLIIFTVILALIFSVIRRSGSRLSSNEHKDFATELSLALNQLAKG